MHADNQTTTLLLGGDVMTGRGIAQVLARRPGRSVEETDDVEAVRLVRLAEQLNGPVPIPVSPRYVWGEALEEIQRAEPDAFIVALETAVKTSEQLACLKAGRVTICALACDGAPHAGEELGQTRRSLAKARMQATGAGRNVAQAQTPAVLVLGPRHRVLVYSWAAPDCGAAVDAAAAPDRPGIAVLPDLAVRRHRNGATAISSSTLSIGAPATRSEFPRSIAGSRANWSTATLRTSSTGTRLNIHCPSRFIGASWSSTAAAT